MSHSLALRRDGSVVAWGCGSEDAGQCSVPAGLTSVTAIAAGRDHSLALVGTSLPTSADQCKQDGWEGFAVFRNEGECVSYVASRGRNTP